MSLLVAEGHCVPFLKALHMELDFENDSQMQKLSEAKSGVLLRLASVDELQNAHVLRLCELGFVPGAGLEITRDTPSTMPVLVEINGALLCVERNLAEHFWVEQGGER
jgi:Fe2+ transport system protein FeoA